MIRYPDLSELPAPPEGTGGWPWIVNSQPWIQVMPDGELWPKITLVTPSYNQAQYLECTIRSVLLQGYPNLEYIVIDGKSQDGSAKLIQKYEPWLTYWVSAPDLGQADALQNGFMRSTGERLGWLNSDDLLLPGALYQIGILHRLAPTSLIAGSVINWDTQSGQEEVIHQRGLSLDSLLQLWKRSYRWHQPGLLFPRQAYEYVGGLDTSLRYGMDYDLLCRLLRLNLPVMYTDQCLAKFRLHPTSKTRSENTRMALELYRISARYWSLLGRSRWSCAVQMFWHMTLRSAKNLAQGDVIGARDSLVGGGRLFVELGRSA